MYRQIAGTHSTQALGLKGAGGHRGVLAPTSKQLEDSKVTLGGETEAGGHSEQSPVCTVTHNIGLNSKKRERRRGGNREKKTRKYCKSLQEFGNTEQ